eukprot:8139932-Pyramimonas_sp.AAC.1
METQYAATMLWFMRLLSAPAQGVYPARPFSVSVRALAQCVCAMRLPSDQNLRISSHRALTHILHSTSV